MVQGSINIEKYKDLALQKQGEHRKFLASLKKKAPKNLDKIVQQIHQEVFQEIDCTDVLIVVKLWVLYLQKLIFLGFLNISG